MSERHSLIDTITDGIVPVHSEGYRFLAIGAGVSLLLFWLWPPLAWLAVLATAYVAYFFRDPPRVTPLRDGLIVAPADGRISAIERIRPPAELGLGDEPRIRVSTFLSVFDVHINRSPVAGRIARSVYVPGSFLNAALDKASEENERRAVVIATALTDAIYVMFTNAVVRRKRLPAATWSSVWYLLSSFVVINYTSHWFYVVFAALGSFIGTLDRYTLADIMLAKDDFASPGAPIKGTRGPRLAEAKREAKNDRRDHKG